MPTITRWFIKAALVSLVLGLAAGIWQQAASAAGMFPVYLHLLTFGWLTQLIFGVAIWMFPMYSKEHPRGPEWLVWSIFSTLNLGLLLRVVFSSHCKAFLLRRLADGRWSPPRFFNGFQAWDLPSPFGLAFGGSKCRA